MFDQLYGIGDPVASRPFRGSAKWHVTIVRYATARVMRALRRARISNLRWDELSECETSGAVYEVGSRHRLPPDYDEQVAALQQKT